MGREKRDKASAITFSLVGIHCTSNSTSSSANNEIIRRMTAIVTGARIVPFRRAKTSAWLSTWKMTRRPDHAGPQCRMASNTAKASLNCMSLARCRRGTCMENHADPHQPPRPLTPLASV
jgi:hypothetical protein